MMVWPQSIILMRDHVNNKVHVIDPALIELAYVLRGVLKTKAPVTLVCGYRSPETNAAMRRNSDGVASHSYHVKGQAMDIHIPGVPLHVLHTVALRLHRGGVGYYPESDFVHIDVGPPRSWDY